MNTSLLHCLLARLPRRVVSAAPVVEAAAGRHRLAEDTGGTCSSGSGNLFAADSSSPLPGSGLINPERVPMNHCEIKHGRDGRSGAAAGGAAADGGDGEGGVCRRGLVLFAHRHGGPGAILRLGLWPRGVRGGGPDAGEDEPIVPHAETIGTVDGSIALVAKNRRDLLAEQEPPPLLQFPKQKKTTEIKIQSFDQKRVSE